MKPETRPDLDSLIVDMLFNPSRRTREAVAWHMAEARGMERVLLRLARERFGPPPPEIADALTNILCVIRLEYLFDHLYECASWEDFHAAHMRYQPDT